MRIWIAFILFQGAFASHCPFTDVSCAGPNEQACNSINYDFMGCPTTQGFCAPITSWETDRYGNACPNHCPIECPFNQYPCQGQYDSNGCRMSDYCISHMQSCPEEYFDQNGCPPPLWWIDCPEDEISCPPEYNSDGCMMDAYCSFDGQCMEPMFDHRGCQMIVPATCADNEVHCGFAYDSRGCEIDMGCMANFDDCPLSTMDPSGCMVFPPVECGSESIECPQNYDQNGCPTSEPICVPVDNGDCMPESACPVECPESAMLCPYIINGCPETHCYPATVPNEFNQGTCAANCPAQCNWESEVECMGLLDASGCRGPSYCAPVEEECPEEIYDWNGCMIMNDWPECGPEEQMCETFDQDGCIVSRTCSPTMDAAGCPVMCPTSCHAHEYSCPAMTMPGDHCQMPDECYPYMQSQWGGMCPQVCPVMCGENEIPCHNGFTEDGCDLGETCMPVDGDCPATCPVQCGPNEIQCQDVDPQTGCVMNEYCSQASYEGPHGVMCPSFCPVTCGENEMPCGHQFDSQGCLMPDICVPIDEECPQSQFNEMGCPVYEWPVCGPNQMHCTAGYDENWCALGPDFCAPWEEGCPLTCNSFEMECPDAQGGSFCHPATTQNYRGEDCPAFCPAQCDWESEFVCPGVYDSAGCLGPDTCTPIDCAECPKEEFDIMGCPMIEPVECNWDTETVCWGGYDAQGCMAPDFCSPIDSECPESEYDHAGCRMDVHQPLECAANELICDLGHDPQTGCYLGATCEPMYIGNCVNMCPDPIGMYMDGKICPGGFEPNYGCPLMSYWVPEYQECDMMMWG